MHLSSCRTLASAAELAASDLAGGSASTTDPSVANFVIDVLHVLYVDICGQPAMEGEGAGPSSDRASPPNMGSYSANPEHGADMEAGVGAKEEYVDDLAAVAVVILNYCSRALAAPCRSLAAAAGGKGWVQGLKAHVGGLEAAVPQMAYHPDLTHALEGFLTLVE